MNKKFALLSIIITIVVGSFITFYVTNLLMSDLCNMFYGVHDAYFVASIPGFMIALDFTVLFIFLIRYYRYNEFKKAYLKLYSMYLLVNSSIGLVTSILTGTIIYKSFFTPYVFPGYTVISLILHAALLALAIYVRFFAVKKMPDDESKKKIKFKYGFYSVVLGGLTYYAFNKFGAFLWSPVYITWSSLSLTWPFYVSLICPVLLLVHVILYFFDVYKGHELAAVIVSAIITWCTLGFGLSVAVIGSNHSDFISAISMALPLERLATKPINSIFQPVATTLFGCYYVFYSIQSYLKSKEVNNE